MNLIPLQQKQSSDDWQDGVRWENRLRKIEERLDNQERLMWWIIVGYVSSIILLGAILLFHH